MVYTVFFIPSLPKASCHRCETPSMATDAGKRNILEGQAMMYQRVE